MKTIIAVILAFYSFSAAAYSAEIKVEGGGTTIAAVIMPIKDNFEKSTGNKLTIVKSSAVKGVIALHNGTVDVAAGAHPLDDLIAGAEKAGVKIDKSTMVATEIEDNKLIAITHKSNQIKRLSKEQLKGIFTGKISNWKEVGGSNLPIDVVWGKETVGQNLQFIRMGLDGEPVTSKAHETTDYRHILQLVTETPGAIGILPDTMSSARTNTLEIPLIVSPLYLITKGVPNATVQQLMDFYRNEIGYMSK